jgi:hypothetical protein
MSTVFVTGNVGVLPGTPHAEHVRQCFEKASNTEKGTTIYVLGSLFAHGAPKEDMLVYLERLPGNKQLVVAKSAGSMHEWDERRLPGWSNTSRYSKIDLWGMHFQLSPDVHNMSYLDGLIVHCDPKVYDCAHTINADWHEWSDRFGPGGLNSLYSLGVLAEQYKAGLLASEPA